MGVIAAQAPIPSFRKLKNLNSKPMLHNTTFSQKKKSVIGY